MVRRRRATGFYRAIKAHARAYRADEVTALFGRIDEARVDAMARDVATYITTNLPKAIDRREGLPDYRTNPYVLMTSASLLDLSDPRDFAEFLFQIKFYMGLETSFGKSIEAIVLGHYPVGRPQRERWEDPPEKVAESNELVGLSQEEKAKRRTNSVWREVDKSCVVRDRRYMTSVKSGPNCINDTQVEAMKSAIASFRDRWMEATQRAYPHVTNLDIVIGLTYGTDRTTNNKENQILVKLLEHGFEEEDRDGVPGVLIDSSTRCIRVYRHVGQAFWAFVGDPGSPENAPFVYLEVLLALAKALSAGIESASLEERLNLKIAALQRALGNLMFPRGALPPWIREDLSEDELFWLATAMTAFFDEGI